MVRFNSTKFVEYVIMRVLSSGQCLIGSASEGFDEVHAGKQSSSFRVGIHVLHSCVLGYVKLDSRQVCEEFALSRIVSGNGCRY